MSFNTLTYIDSIVWWVIPTNGHYGILEEDQQVTSVHNFETFDNTEDWIERITELGINIKDASMD
jgi:superfamily I DNA and RNA helicase